MISGGFPNYQIPPQKKLSEWVAVFTLSTSISTTCRICWSKVKAFNQETSPGKTNSSLFRVAKVWNNILAWKKWRFGFPPKKCVGRMNDNLILIFWIFWAPSDVKITLSEVVFKGISENPQPERWVFVVFFFFRYVFTHLGWTRLQISKVSFNLNAAVF